MKRLLSSAALLGLSLVTSVPQPASAQAYPIDCAILLCLAGGWPASVPCAKARAEFIRRITPWPVEPPLQIWRCPMQAALEDPAPVRRLRRFAGMSEVPQWTAPKPEILHLTQAVGLGADIDISGAAFDFIRSIDVFQVQAWQQESDNGENCNRIDHVRHGSYDTTGQFRWSNSSVFALPPAFRGLESYGAFCPSLSVRSVFVDWQDSAGTYGFEQVDY